ncbi:TPA: thioredoxin domain-containing protein [Candidatus Micrarchaeota archaeon]|nr:thioredoxin domain-containing protein [Candidatus Micrarchaeota archaeon]
MALCIIALVVFGFLGIFSAKYRALAKEAFQCVFRMVTLRPCESSFDERLKAQIVARTLSFSPSAARLVNNNFKALSWIFTIIFFASLAYSAFSAYNYWAYGNCNGPNSSQFCALDAVFNPGGQHSFTAPAQGIGPTLGSGSITLVEFGCFTCPYTKQAEEFLKAFLEKHPEVKLEWRSFPIPAHAFSHEAAEAAYCAEEQGKFWEYGQKLFNSQGSFSMELFLQMAKQLGLDEAQFNECFASKKYASKVGRDFEDGKKAGVYGTPTFFLNESALIGPKTVEQFENGLKNKVVDTAVEIGSCPPPAQTAQKQ